MPELPEVENVRLKLQHLVLNKKVSHVEVRAERIIRTPKIDDFLARIKNQTIYKIERKGKHLIFVFDDYKIVSHLRMEGKFHFTDNNESYSKHDHVIFHFDDKTQLRYNDVRKFGTMDLVLDENEVSSVKELGIEPLNSNLDAIYLKSKLLKKKTNIKNALLDQSIIAGLGNIYVDEVLFRSMIHPKRIANTLTTKETKKLISSINTIIDTAIKSGGSSIRSYDSMGEKGSMQDLHNVYGKNNQPCIGCGSRIEKIKISGRGTHFCPNCQK